MAEIVISQQLKVRDRCFPAKTHSAAGLDKPLCITLFEYMLCTLHGVMDILETLGAKGLPAISEVSCSNLEIKKLITDIQHLPKCVKTQ